jgi:hypothetical protein
VTSVSPLRRRLRMPRFALESSFTWRRIQVPLRLNAIRSPTGRGSSAILAGLPNVGVVCGPDSSTNGLRSDDSAMWGRPQPWWAT